MASHVAQVDEKARDELIRDVSTALGNYVDDEGLAFPIEAHLALARK